MMHARRWASNYTLRSTKFKGVILVSPCPPVRLSVCRQNRNRVRSVSSTIFILPIYTHLIKQPQKACSLKIIFICFSKFWSFGKFFKFYFILFWLWIQYELVNGIGLGSNMNWSIVRVIMWRRGYPKKAGFLFDLVFIQRIRSLNKPAMRGY